jgi:hypothetical protein
VRRLVGGHGPAGGARSVSLNQLVALDFSFYVGVPLPRKVKPFTVIAIVIFLLMGALHVLRLIFGWEVVINGLVMPMWGSVVGLIVAGGLAVMLWRESSLEKH